MGLFFKILLKCFPSKKRYILLKNKVHYMGKNVIICTSKIGTEPYLLSFHDDVIVGADVSFLTHDASCFIVTRYLKMEPGRRLDKVGSIELMQNCFIGAGSIILPCVTVGENSIVAAGSIVNKNIPANEVWGGTPAKFIMSIEDYSKKLKQLNMEYSWMNDYKFKKLSAKELRKEREKYFFKE